MESKWSQNGSQIRPKTPRGRSKSAPEKESKNDSEIGAKREPKWRPKGIHNLSKKVSKNEVDHRRAPRAPQGRLWDDIGSIFGDFLVHFCVFPCVYYVFRVESDVFPRVYEDSTLRFFRIFWKGQIASFFVLGLRRNRPAKRDERASEQARARERERARARESGRE